uniref:Uncharacterized protein n=1 Tax=Klebsiella phage FKP3 TaxID=3231233 RepID=A0AAU8HZE2_9CAUD
MKVAILIEDCGDGSSCLRWFKDLDLAEALAYSDDYCEEFGGSEGTTVIEVGDDFIPPGGFDDNCEWDITDE